MNTLKTVFNKLSLKDNKEKLSSQKIELSVMDDIEEFLGQGFGLEEFVEEELEKAEIALTKASDIIKFDMTDAYTQAEGLIDEAEEVLADLGAESPVLEGYKEQLQDLEKLKVFIKKYKSQKLLMNQDLSFWVR